MYPMRRMLAGAGLALALLLAPTWAPSALATSKISNVRVSTTEAGGDAAESGTVPTDASGIWALFDYTDASKTRIKVVVFNNAGTPLLEIEDRYTGAGTARVEVTANALVHEAASFVEVYADSIHDLAEMGADTRRVDGEIVNARTSLESYLRSLSSVMVPMDRAGLTGAALEAKQTIARLFPEVQDAVNDLAATSATDVAGMRTRLTQLEPTAADLAAAAAELDDEVSKLTAFTMAALYTDNAAYTVSVKVDELGGSSSAGSAELVVVQASKSANPGAAAGNTSPTATSWLPPTFNGIGDGAGTRQNTPVPTSAPAGTTAPGRGTAAVEGGQAVAATLPAEAIARVDAKAATSVALGTVAAPGAVGADGSAAAPAAGLESSSPIGQGQAAMNGRTTAGGQSAGAPGASGSSPLPTFTVPAGGAAAGGAASTGGGGPNLFVLGAGIAVLVGLALWFRRRL